MDGQMDTVKFELLWYQNWHRTYRVPPTQPR